MIRMNDYENFNPIIGLILTPYFNYSFFFELYFNPIIGLILTIPYSSTMTTNYTFQSHYRSDFNLKGTYDLRVSYTFQSHYRFDFNWLEIIVRSCIRNFNPIIGLILTGDNSAPLSRSDISIPL